VLLLNKISVRVGCVDSVVAAVCNTTVGTESIPLLASVWPTVAVGKMHLVRIGSAVLIHFPHIIGNTEA